MPTFWAYVSYWTWVGQRVIGETGFVKVTCLLWDANHMFTVKHTNNVQVRNVLRIWSPKGVGKSTALIQTSLQTEMVPQPAVHYRLASFCVTVLVWCWPLNTCLFPPALWLGAMPWMGWFIAPCRIVLRVSKWSKLVSSYSHSCLELHLSLPIITSGWKKKMEIIKLLNACKLNWVRITRNKKNPSHKAVV